ncbi:hypothetical protein Trydic_g20412 [Trypoxylus dichotomus]
MLNREAWYLYRDRAWKESPKFCQIIMDKPERIYIPGETVSGLVNIVINKPQRIRGIIIHYKGLCETFLIDYYLVRYSMQYSGKQEYFDVSEYCKGGKTHPAFTLQPGVYSYRFIYKLPPRLPSSFQGDAGYVAYFVEVILHRAFRKNLNNLLEFTVTPTFSLEAYPNLNTPARKKLDKHFLHCCRHGLIEAKLELPKTGYHAGDEIPILIYIDNCSTVKIKQADLQFRLLVTYYNESFLIYEKNARRVPTVFDEIKLGPVRQGIERTWQKSFRIPNIPTSCPYELAILKREYQIYLKLKVGGYKPLPIIIPIFIGTSPKSNKAKEGPSNSN